MLLKEVFRRSVKLYSDKLAVVDANHQWTFREFDERVNRLANGLNGLGVVKGSRVGLLMKNRAEYLEAIGAGAKTGIIIVPINIRLGEEELNYVISHSQCDALILDDEFAGLVSGMKPLIESLKHCIVLDSPAGEMHVYESLLANASSDLKDIKLDENDLAGIMYTSGTTGLPKGAVSTQRIMGERCLVAAIELSIQPRDRYLTVLPLFHIGGQTSLAYLCMGATNYIMGDWEVKNFCETVQNEKISAVTLVPTILNLIVNYPDVSRYDVSSVNTILYGGSPMPEIVLRAGLNLFGCNFVQGLGSTENYISVVLKPEDHVVDGSKKQVSRLMAAGREAIMCEARVVNNQGEDVILGEVGEVITRGAGNLLKYWDNPEETAKKLRDNWYYTGDLGRVDEDGYIFLVERKNDMIISGGENIYPKEVENILFSHPAIFEAAVIGVPDDTWGESVKAIVVLKPGSSSDEAEVIQYCKDNLASYKKPKSVEFVDVLPKTAAGKVLKRKLREPYWQNRKRSIN